MSRRCPLAVILLLVVVAIVLPATAHAQIRWGNSFDAALRQARQSNKLVMVDFYTDWCTWCKVLDQKTYTETSVIRQAGGFISVKINAEKEGRTAATRYNVTGFPTVLFLNGNGGVMNRVGGYLPPDRFLGEMREAQNRRNSLAQMDSRLRQQGGNAKFAAEATEKFANIEDKPRALAALRRLQAADPRGAKGYLASGSLAVGGMLLRAHDFSGARPLLRTAAGTANRSLEKAYAHFYLALCDLQQRQAQAAIPHLKASLAQPGLPQEFRDHVQGVLEAVQSGKAG